ncbi:MAG: serine hydrolase domain-containing protein [Solirubrobacteraceae bacterium]
MATSREGMDRRTLLKGAAGALVAAGLRGPVPALGRAAPRFDPVLARRLQRVLRAALRDPATQAPGAILHVESPALGTWTGVAGLARVAPSAPMRAADHFRAGSIAKMFVATVVLQLAERGRLSLDARLPAVLPASVTGRVANAPEITVRMLLDHRSGIPEWETAAVDAEIGRNPAKVWTIGEILDLAAAQPPAFVPGTSYRYSNTDYNLLGLIIERVTGHSWRREVTRRVIDPLGLTQTSLPAPGHRSLPRPYAHGYAESGGRRIDLTGVDPSMAGAAGGSALVSTVRDLPRFLDALLAGRLFRHRATLRQMLAFAPAPDVGGQVGYGLGIERRVLPGGVEAIGHLGGTAGYRAYVARLRPPNATIALVLNAQDDPTPLVVPAAKLLAAAHR